MSDKHYVRIIDSDGFFVEDAFVDELTEFTIEMPCPDGFYLPKWDGEKWIEGGSAPVPTAEEIALAAKQAEIQRLIDGGSCDLPDELDRHYLASSETNDAVMGLFEYLSECFPEQFGI